MNQTATVRGVKEKLHNKILDVKAVIPSKATTKWTQYITQTQRTVASNANQYQQRARVVESSALEAAAAALPRVDGQTELWTKQPTHCWHC